MTKGIYYSTGRGDDYFVVDARTKKVVPDVIIIIPHQNYDNAEIVDMMGFREIAENMVRSKQEQEKMKGVDGEHN